MLISIFGVKYLHESKQVCETRFPAHKKPKQKQKHGGYKSCDTLPLTNKMLWFSWTLPQKSHVL